MIKWISILSGVAKDIKNNNNSLTKLFQKKLVFLVGLFYYKIVKCF